MLGSSSDPHLALQAFLELLSVLSTGRPVFQVVTTRVLPGPARALRQLPQLPLGPLEQLDAMSLLRQHCPSLTLPDKDAAAVATICEGNALLLTLMGSFLEDERCTVEVGPRLCIHACVPLAGLGEPASSDCDQLMVLD